MWRQNRTHSVFALRTISNAWRARGLQQKLFFPKPCGLENTHDTVMDVHKLVVSTPNKRAQTRGSHNLMSLSRLDAIRTENSGHRWTVLSRSGTPGRTC